MILDHKTDGTVLNVTLSGLTLHSFVWKGYSDCSGSVEIWLDVHFEMSKKELLFIICLYVASISGEIHQPTYCNLLYFSFPDIF